MRAIERYARRLQAEVADEMKFQVKHFGPEVGELFVANPLLPGDVRAGYETLLPRVFPMRLPAHATHDAIWVEREIADCENAFFLGL